MTADIRIHEIFYSIQGEGFHSGKPAIFLRTAGCNLACSFCDTDFSLVETLSPQNILDRFQEYPCKFVVLTGGEPTLQHRELKPLLELLQSRGYYIAMETNGSLSEATSMALDWITVSPKLSQKGKWVVKQGNELKLVYEGQDLKPYLDSEFEHYYLQPMEKRSEPWGNGQRLEQETREEWRKTIDAVKNNPTWNLSFQLHKELQIR
jgi:organic radical activating enzyme